MNDYEKGLLRRLMGIINAMNNERLLCYSCKRLSMLPDGTMTFREHGADCALQELNQLIDKVSMPHVCTPQTANPYYCGGCGALQTPPNTEE